MDDNYYKKKDSVEEYIRLSKDVNGKELIEKLKSYLPSSSSILEIGSGPGSDWEILTQNFDVVGSDNSKEFLNHLNLTYPSGKFIELDAVSIDVNDSFDALYSNKVMQHLKDDELMGSIMKQHSILNADGIICHSFWKGEGSEIFKGLFVNYQTEQTLTRFFDDHFELLLLEDYAEFEKGDSLLFIGRKKEL